jgi:hypothetical protein
MGAKFNYKCSKCRFIAQCSYGKDRGFRTAVEAMFCKECKTFKGIQFGTYILDRSGKKLVPTRPICNKCNKSDTLQT